MLQHRGTLIRPIAAGLVVACLVGCSSWRTVSTQHVRPAGEEVRLAMVNGARRTLMDARVIGDSVVGTEQVSGAGRQGTTGRQAFARGDIVWIRARRPDAAKTAGMVLGVGVGVVVVGGLIAYASSPLFQCPTGGCSF